MQQTNTSVYGTVVFQVSLDALLVVSSTLTCHAAVIHADQDLVVSSE